MFISTTTWYQVTGSGLKYKVYIPGLAVQPSNPHVDLNLNQRSLHIAYHANMQIRRIDEAY